MQHMREHDTPYGARAAGAVEEGPAARAPNPGTEVGTMWWRGRHRKAAQSRTDGSWPYGRHRHVDGDTVPFADGRRWVDYLPTQEIPIISTVDRPLMTRIAELRAPGPGRRSA